MFMEIDTRMRASNVAILVYHPHIKHRAGRQGASSSAAEIVVDDSDDEDEDEDEDERVGGDAAKNDVLRRQHSGGSVKVEDGVEELGTHEAINLRDALELPALAAAITIEVSLGWGGGGGT